MTETKALLQKRIDEEYAAFKKEWKSMSKNDLIENALAIYAVNRCCALLTGAISEEDATFLLRFGSPLQVMSDLYRMELEENSPMFYEVCGPLLQQHHEVDCPEELLEGPAMG